MLENLLIHPLNADDPERISAAFAAQGWDKPVEIADLNVLKLYQRRGIASALLEAAERLAAKQSLTVGIGVGLSADYGPAQRLYVRRGYIPDGHGAFQGDRPLHFGDTVHMDDSLALYLTRELSLTAAEDGAAHLAASAGPGFGPKLKEMQEILENL